MELFDEIIPLKLNDIKNMQIKSLNLNEFIKIDDTLSLNHYTCTFIKNYLNNQLNVSNFIKNIDIHFTNDNFDYDLKELLNTHKEANGGYFDLYTENGNSICVGFDIPEIQNSNYLEYLGNIIDNIIDTIYFVSIDFDVDKQFDETYIRYGKKSPTTHLRELENDRDNFLNFAERLLNNQ